MGALMSLRIHIALERWRAAERALAATPPDAAERRHLKEQLVAARDAYLAAVIAVAEEQGADAMPALTETQRTGSQDGADKRGSPA